MEEEKVPIIKQAMHYGALLGLFWLVRYSFLIASGFSDFMFIYIYLVLNVGTFLLIYAFYFKYKDIDNDPPRNMIQCIAFTVLMCFFASFFESAIMYAHYQVVHPEFFTEKVLMPNVNLFKMALDNSLSGADPVYAAKVKKFILNVVSSKFFYIVGLFAKNILLGFFLSLVIGLVSIMKKD